MSAGDVTLGPGAVLGRYRIVRILGSGGMGTVFEARHVLLDTRVALKVLQADIAARSEAMSRFLREGQAAARIRHRHVVRVTDVDNHDGVAFMVMECLEGEDLGKRLEREGRLSIEDCLDVVLPAIDAVAAAHDVGIVHRDLKPENVFLTTGRHGELHPKVLDFGISKLMDTGDGLQLTGTRALLGTPFYMAPEQAWGAKDVGPGADQYAFGTIVYECVTGRRPFENDNLYLLLDAIVRQPCPPPRQIAPELPEGFEQVLLRAMAKDPGARFPSLRAFARALLPYARPSTRSFWAQELEHGEASASAEVTPPGAPSGSAPGAPGASTFGTEALERWTARTIHGRRGWLYAAALLLLVAGGGTAWALWSGTLAGARSGGAPSAAAAPTADTIAISIEAHPPEAELTLDGEPAGTGTLEREVSTREPHVLRVHADGFEPQTFVFREAPPPATVRLQAVETEDLPRGESLDDVVATGSSEPSGPSAPARAPRSDPRGTSDRAELVEGEAEAERAGEAEPASETERESAAEREVPARRHRQIRVRNDRRAAVQVTVRCRGGEAGARVGAGDTSLMTVGTGDCQVVCTGLGEPRCPLRLREGHSSLVVR